MTFTLMTIARKKFTESIENSKTDENSEKDEYLEINLEQVLYIQYPIIF